MRFSVYAIAAVIISSTAGCSLGSDSDSAKAEASRNAEKQAASAQPTGGPVTRPPDPKAPTEITPVTRPGKTGTRLPAAEKKMNETVDYSDKVTVRVTSVKQSTASGAGPGVLVGAPQQLHDIEIHNGTGKPLDLSAVVVSARYGNPEQLATGAYSEGTKDFTGELAPGSNARATYGFTVPHDQKTRIVVDIDAVHAPAVFRSAT
ncbi:hypothetical protein [Austwickia chelonae]|uniref:DUF4352 domain-containing protein n=1 Tax=Austwickia chelonae NBRC 105200 TaxID=1184607 RepID=K6V9Z6_9MICO|nr:hypothetical protein [Austwickia chelonae]GAB79038.1 hypothetical protein AUCHE_18_00390 [Austwickia chelonae NBRC 105200]